jgi:hypothetical protein
MTTATVEPGIELDRAVENLERKIEDKRAEILEWEAKKKNIEQELAATRADHASACEALALDRGSSKAVSSLASEISDLEDRLLGTTRILVLRRSQHVELRNQLAPLHLQQTERVQALRIAEEAEQTAQKIARAEKALSDKTEAERVFVSTIIELRSQTYLGEASRRQAMDAAQRLERISGGMRP